MGNDEWPRPRTPSQPEVIVADGPRAVDAKLALVGTFLFILLLILGAIVAIPSGLLIAIVGHIPSGPAEIVVLGSLPALVVCFFAGRAGWRTLVRREAAS